MLNKTDFKILRFCSRTYGYMSSKEISKGINLHVSTVSNRINNLIEKEYLKRKTRSKGFAYKFDFYSPHARAFRLFVDMSFVCNLGLSRVVEFIKNNRTNTDILFCQLYGSSLQTKKFNDMDLLIIYDEEKIDAHGFDVFQMDVKTFRNLYSLGEPRLQAALVTGRILLDRNFIFSYLENELPIMVSEDILYELKNKYKDTIKTIERTKDMGKEELQSKLWDALKTKAIIEFASHGKVVPSKIGFLKDLGKIEPGLAGIMKKVKSMKKKKELWDMFYADILE